jgi:aspartyl-tRNA(Asn)/glutamyl-tRNA(Gln) amidotransferase subunit B
LIERVKSELPELPGARIRTLAADVAFDQAVDLVTTGNEHKARLLVEHGLDWPTAANVSMNQLAAIDPLPENGPALVAIIQQRDAITREALMAAFADSAAGPLDADAVLAEQVVADTSELEPLVDRILADSPGQVAAYKGGKEGLLGYFVGQVMKETQGKADPKVVNALIRGKLS